MSKVTKTFLIKHVLITVARYADFCTTEFVEIWCLIREVYFGQQSGYSNGLNQGLVSIVGSVLIHIFLRAQHVRIKITGYFCRAVLSWVQIIQKRPYPNLKMCVTWSLAPNFPWCQLRDQSQILLLILSKVKWIN